jgi:uncharacterized membrane protein YfcA
VVIRESQAHPLAIGPAAFNRLPSIQSAGGRDCHNDDYFDQSSPDSHFCIETPLPLGLLTAFCGFWAGLIIVDAAIFLLLSLVLVGGISLRQAVPVKTGMVFLFSISTFLIFARSGKVEWQIGIPMVLGSIVGSLIGARLVMSKYANQWVYRCLIVIVLIETVRLFL